MRFMATMFSTQTKTKVFRFGYTIDNSGRPAWKSDGIKKDFDFKRIISESIFDEDRNKFKNIVVLMEISTNGGIAQLLGNKGTTFFELNLMAQPDNGGTNNPPTAKFSKVTLTDASITFLPGDTTPCQQLYFSFEKGSASWDGE